MATKIGRLVSYHDWLLPIMLLHLWLRGIPRSRDKLKSLYIHYNNTYAHNTWQDDELP